MTKDTVNTGVNLFLLRDQDVTDALNMQSVYKMMYGDGASLFLDKAAALVKAKVGALRLIFNAHQQLKCFEIINNILLSGHYQLCTPLNVFGNRVVSSKHILHQLHMQYLLLPTLLYKKIAV